MPFLRLYLLAGLVAHKLVWEVMKRRPSSQSEEKQETMHPALLLIKALKIAILIAVTAQTLVPDVLPLASNPQILRGVGVVIYTAGLLVAVLARIQLGSNWSDIEAPRIDHKQAVVARGLYRYVRHPIYLGDLALLAGLELSLNSWLLVGVAALVPIVLREAVREERTLATKLAGYDLYCKRTKRFIPLIV
jgi:protein-S-isoprenylcysteine O-methyltransferase Ste14